MSFFSKKPEAPSTGSNLTGVPMDLQSFPGVNSTPLPPPPTIQNPGLGGLTVPQVSTPPLMGGSGTNGGIDVMKMLSMMQGNGGMG